MKFIRHERLRFWSDPDTELKLAKNTGVTVFRMGVDWTRIMPKEPTGELNKAVSSAFLYALLHGLVCLLHFPYVLISEV